MGQKRRTFLGNIIAGILVSSGSGSSGEVARRSPNHVDAFEGFEPFETPHIPGDLSDAQSEHIRNQYRLESVNTADEGTKSDFEIKDDHLYLYLDGEFEDIEPETVSPIFFEDNRMEPVMYEGDSMEAYVRENRACLRFNPDSYRLDGDNVFLDSIEPNTRDERFLIYLSENSEKGFENIYSRVGL